MHPKKFKVAAILLLLLHVSFGLTITAFNDDSVDVIVSRGAVINYLPDLDVFTEMEYIFFAVPDVPEVPRMTDIKCTDGIDTKLCDMFTESKAVMNDIQEEIKITNRILTTKGLRDATAYTPEKINTKWFDTLRAVDVHSDSPTQDLKEAVGTEYLSEVEMRLAMRKLLQLDSSGFTMRERRWVTAFIKPALRVAATVVSKVDLEKLFRGLFTGDNGIINALAAFRAASPVDKKAFTDLSSKVSEFESETRKLFVDVLQKTEDVENTISQLQNQHYEYTLNIVGFKALVFNHQSLFLDLMKLLYVSNVYNMHFEAFTECRSGKISPVFVPPSLLIERLQALEAKMPVGMELVYPWTEASRYYSMQNAECIYDSRGGVIKIGVPIRNKKAAYKTYEYRPLQFAFNEYTCSLDTPATIIIKDENTNEIYPITELELESCQVKSGLCLLPLSADMDSSSVCIAILLKGSPADVIKDNCKLQCSQRANPQLSKILEDVYIGTHLPQKGVTIRCPDETIEVKHTASHGSTKISLVCTSCDIYWDNVVVGKASRTPCQDELRPTIETLLPIQFSTLKDMKPYDENGLESAKFTSATGILNEDYNPDGNTAVPVNDVDIFISILTKIWGTLQSLATMYVMYRSHFVHGVVAAGVNNMVRGVGGARDDYTCKLPTTSYVLLWAILGVCLCILIPAMVMKIYRFIVRQCEQSVDAAATRQRLEMVAVQ